MVEAVAAFSHPDRHHHRRHQIAITGGVHVYMNDVYAVYKGLALDFPDFLI